MRMIDSKRELSMSEIKVYAKSIISLAEEYESVFGSESMQPQKKMDKLDAIWRIITNYQTRLTEVLRENGL